jgi:hypothetical protein
MKKFLSLMLAGLMSASLFVVGAAAEEPKKETVVGKDGGVLDADFTKNETSNDNNINVKVEAVTHKYAVDLTFNFTDLTIGGLVWNVETLRYDFAEGKALTDSEQTITVTNRSDKPVYAWGTVTDGDANDYVTVGMKTGETGSGTNDRLEVAKATAGQTANGTATNGKLTVSISSANWANVANYYGKKVAETEDPSTVNFKAATVTVTISKNATK